MRKQAWFLRCLLVSILLLVFPVLAVSAGTPGYRTTMVTTVTAPQSKAVDLGALVVEFDPVAKGDHKALVALPRGYAVQGMGGTVQGVEDPHTGLELGSIGTRNEFIMRINYTGDPKKLTFVVPIKTIVPADADGDIMVEITGIEGQFADGSVLVGRIAGGKVDFAVVPQTMRMITPGTEIPFRMEVTESQGAVLRAGSATLRLSLPEGFTWGAAAKAEVTLDGGYEPTARVDSVKEGLLYVDIQETTVRTEGGFVLSGTIVAQRTVQVGSEVKVRVSGIDLTREVALVAARTVAAGIEARFFVGRDLYMVNGIALTLDVVPYTENGRLFLPLRYVGLSLGVEPDNIKWDGAAATLAGHGKTIIARPGGKQLVVDGQAVEMDVAAKLVQGRVMLPYRFIAEAFGASVDWDPTARTVSMEL